MSTDFWIGGHQEKAIKLDLKIDSDYINDTDNYFTALSNDKFIVLIKYDKSVNKYNKMIRCIINKSTEVIQEHYNYPNLPDYIEGDWNYYLTKYEIDTLKSSNECVNSYNNKFSSFYNNKIYTSDILNFKDQLINKGLDTLEVSIKETKIENNKCLILGTNKITTNVHKIIDDSLKDGESIEILSSSPYPVSVFYVGGDREPEEVKVTKDYYPTDKVYFYAKNANEYNIICKGNDRLLGIKRYQQDTLIKFDTQLVDKPNILSNDYKMWQTPIANTWTTPNLNNYSECGKFILTDTLEGYEAYPFISTKEVINEDTINFQETYSLDLLQDVIYTNTTNNKATTKLQDLLLDDNNTYKYPSNNINCDIIISALSNNESDCKVLNNLKKKTQLKKLVNQNIKKTQIKILAASPISSTSRSRIRGTNNNSVRMRANRLSN